jgi:hypothetical protein
MSVPQSRIGVFSIVLVLSVAVSLFSNCGPNNQMPCAPDVLLDKAQSCPDHIAMQFGLEVRSGTRIGTAPIESVAIRNGGLEDLTISSVSVLGDSAFTVMTAPGMLPAAIKGKKNFIVTVAFAPTQAKLYTGSLSIVSNAQNTPTQVIQLSGCGIPTDGGTTPCYLDGGRPQP